jgi:magnesium-transporting ATPase (P-type)
MFKLRNLFLAIGIIASISFTSTSVVSAQIHELRCGANSAATGTDTKNNGCAKAPANAPSLNDTVTKIINILSSLVAVVAVIMIIVGGFRYVTSGGDSARVTSARSTIFNAIIGLAIAILAQVIVRFVIYEVK